MAPGTPITFSATVSPAVAGGTMPTGTVAFLDGAYEFAAANLNSDGNATVTGRTATAGTRNHRQLWRRWRSHRKYVGGSERTGRCRLGSGGIGHYFGIIGVVDRR